MNWNQAHGEKHQDAYTYQTFDNHGQPVWVRMPPPSRWDYRRHHMREAAYLAVGALVLAAIAALTVILIALVTEPRPAAGASDAPGKPTYVCRHKLVSVSPWRTEYRKVCRWIR